MDQLLNFLFPGYNIEDTLRETFQRIIVPATIDTAKALIVLFITLWLSERIRQGVKKLLARHTVDPNVQGLVGRMAYLGILVLGILVILRIFGVDTATVVAFVGIFGLAASLAAQDIMKSFLSGIYLLIERPFHIGDRIAVADKTGTVEEVGFRTTRIVTDDNEKVYVPNSTIFSTTVVNVSHKKSAPPKTAPPPGEATETPANPVHKED